MPCIEVRNSGCGQLMRGQTGAVVLAAVTVLLLLVVIVQVYQNSAYQMASEAGDDLAFARDALIEYSVNYPSHYAETGAGPGHLPCPDISGNGSPAPSCSGSPVGLLPVDFETSAGKNISLLSRQSHRNEPIWYVLSSAFRYSPVPSGAPDSATIVNSNSRGNLTFDGEGEVIALLIAPGAALDGQQRDGSLDISDFLEGENSDGDLVFASGQGNDHVLALRWRDLMPLVERRVLAAIRGSVKNYQHDHGYLPWLAQIGVPMEQGDSQCVICQRTGWIASERYYSNRAWPPYTEQHCSNDVQEIVQAVPSLPVWLVRNYWHRLVWIHVRAGVRDQACPASSDPVFDGDDVDALMVSIGPALKYPRHGLGPQRREGPAALAQLLDQADWITGEGEYLSVLPASDVNDQWSVLP